jgi:hypothetical protein
MVAAHPIDPEEARERALARWHADERRAEHDLGLFIEMHNPKYDRPDHLAPLLEALDRSMSESVYALVEVAPRHGKTETILAAAARRLRYRPEDQVFYCSYAASLALRKSRRARAMAQRAGVWAGDEKIISKGRSDPASAVSFWQTLEGGSFTAGGRGGSFTGEGYQMGIFDDPYKNRAEAESPVIQDAVLETWRGTLGNRIEPRGSMFITHQAWNDLDIIATLKAEIGSAPHGQDWEIISLPAVIDPVYDETTDELIGGTPLWPARWSLQNLARKKYDVKEYNWYSQYTNDRKPRGDQIFGEPARYVEPTINGAVVIISCDPGIEDNKMKDSSGIVVGSCYRRPGPYHTVAQPQMELRIDVLHAEDLWRDTPDLLDYLELLQRDRFRGAPILLEEVSAFKILSQVAKRLNPKLRLYPISPKGSKLLRAQPTGKAWNGGLIRTPLGGEYGGSWVDDFHRETQRFTGRAGGKDNRVDALTQLFDYAGAALAGIAGAESGGESEWASSPF